MATHRQAATTNPYCQRVYSFDSDRYKRDSAPTSRELAQHERFATVSRAVHERAIDLTKMAADKAAFIAQKDIPGGKTTMKSFLWKLEVEAYDQSNGQHPKGTERCSSFFYKKYSK